MAVCGTTPGAPGVCGALKLPLSPLQGLNRRLGWLNLAYNNIGPMGCHWLGVALEVQPSGLRILNLSWNANIGLRGFDRIAQSLASNTALEV